MYHRVFRLLVLLLAGWPLLMPPGLCICQLIRAEKVIPDSVESMSTACLSAEDQDEDCCSDSCCVREKANCAPCVGEDQGVPSKPECPANCPASGKAGHFELVEHQHLGELSVATPAPLLFFVAPQTIDYLTAIHYGPLPPAVLPIYLSLCTLLI